nr:MAG TPA: hypothetical protein [Caudoviricetes sp.]
MQRGNPPCILDLLRFLSPHIQLMSKVLFHSALKIMSLVFFQFFQRALLL